jgi:hypothetical protein
MNAVYLFLVEASITVLPGALILVVWSKSLRRVLLDLCGTESRANFWLVYSNIMLLLTPLLLVFLFGASPKSQAIDFTLLKRALGCALFGSFFAMAIIGLQISKFIPRSAPPNLSEVTK